ncbi:hypothetical protein SAMN05444157_0737 [Frankineae bacterium MT45]|nr:hypothetical protein SAMN05444157_0737 [Frankineae bacterium MT45]
MSESNYESTMAYGADQYRDVLDRLNHDGLPAEFIQTGGMNAAIMVTLEAGHHLLVTDQEDALAWDRSGHRGWYVGLYPADEGEQPIRWLEANDGSASMLFTMIDRLLRTDDKRVRPLG